MSKSNRSPKVADGGFFRKESPMFAIPSDDEESKSNEGPSGVEMPQHRLHKVVSFSGPNLPQNSNSLPLAGLQGARVEDPVSDMDLEYSEEVKAANEKRLSEYANDDVVSKLPSSFKFIEGKRYETSQGLDSYIMSKYYEKFKELDKLSPDAQFWVTACKGFDLFAICSQIKRIPEYPVEADAKRMLKELSERIVAEGRDYLSKHDQELLQTLQKIYEEYKVNEISSEKISQKPNPPR